MKIIRLISLAFLVMLMSILSGFILSYSAKEISPNPPKITLTNFKDPPQVALSSNVLTFADLAWRTFVTLNWPASYDGKPLEKFALGEAPNTPRVWELYRTPDEVFLPQGENPELKPSQAFARTLHLDLMKGQENNLQELQEGYSLEENLDKSRAWIDSVLRGECPGELPICQEEKKLFLDKIPLVDRQGNYIIVEIHLNHNEFRQIVNNGWYNAQKLAEYSDKNRFQFKSTSSKSDGDAPIEVKAAWRIFDENSSPAEKARYYTTKRILSIPASQYICTKNNCRTDDPVLDEVEVGLVGFHIAYKIPVQQGASGTNATPGWIWATFEQVDNLQVQNPPSGVNLKPTLSDPNCQGNADRANCKPNYPYLEWPFLWRDRGPHAVTKTPEGMIKEQIPTQVVRRAKNVSLASTVKEELKQQNKKWQRAFREVANDSVWQYYELIGTQWLKNPMSLDSNQSLSADNLISKIRKSEIAPEPLFNVAMEAYAQSQVNGDSCIACHVSATLPRSQASSQKNLSDFSFLLERAQSTQGSSISLGKVKS